MDASLIALLMQIPVIGGIGYILWERRKLRLVLDEKWASFGVDEEGTPTWEGIQMLFLYRRWFITPPDKRRT